MLFSSCHAIVILKNGKHLGVINILVLVVPAVIACVTVHFAKFASEE